MDNEKKWLFGPRKTTDKSVSDMGMYELALNNCFVKDHQAYFRDFSEEVSTRDIIRQISKTLNCAGMFDEEMHDNDAFDTMLYEWLEDGIEEKTGVLALLSELMWAKAELHAKLKRYEDAEERGEIGCVPRWIPVTPETMPKAEEKVFVMCRTSSGGRYVCCTMYIPEGLSREDSDYNWDYECCTYSEEDDEYYVGSGWYERIHNWDDYSAVNISDIVTHWMPMPELPEVE